MEEIDVDKLVRVDPFQGDRSDGFFLALFVRDEVTRESTKRANCSPEDKLKDVSLLKEEPKDNKYSCCMSAEEKRKRKKDKERERQKCKKKRKKLNIQMYTS